MKHSGYFNLLNDTVFTYLRTSFCPCFTVRPNSDRLMFSCFCLKIFRAFRAEWFFSYDDVNERVKTLMLIEFPYTKEVHFLAYTVHTLALQLPTA